MYDMMQAQELSPGAPPAYAYFATGVSALYLCAVYALCNCTP